MHDTSFPPFRLPRDFGNDTGCLYSAYSVENIERLFRRFRQVDTRDSSNSIQAVSATNQLVTIRARIEAGLSARLLELKTEMDKEFGTAFVDMESYLRTERGE